MRQISVLQLHFSDMEKDRETVYSKGVSIL